MPRYIIEREVGKLTPEQLDAAGRKSNSVLAEMPHVVWIKSYVSGLEGKIYCEYDAPRRGGGAGARASHGHSGESRIGSEAGDSPGNVHVTGDVVRAGSSGF